MSRPIDAEDRRDPCLPVLGIGGSIGCALPLIGMRTVALLPAGACPASARWRWWAPW